MVLSAEDNRRIGLGFYPYYKILDGWTLDIPPDVGP